MTDKNDADHFAVPAPRKPSPQQAPPLKYDKPGWGAVAQYPYAFEVLKGGLSVERIEGPRKDCITIGIGVILV